MSTPQWQNLPMPRGGEDWTSFSVDPREAQNAQMRASDNDRSTASNILATAYADGRLDQSEYDQRLDQVNHSKVLGELVPVVSDVMLPARAPQPPQQTYYPPAQSPSPEAQSGPPWGQRGPGFLRNLPSWWFRLAIILNVIWLITVFSSRHFIYYWPIWPMLGTAIPMLLAWRGNSARRDERQQRWQQRDQQRQVGPGQDNDLR